MPGMRGQHGNGYQCCQDCKSKLLHAGHFAPIEHTNCFSSHPPPPPSPNPPHHDSDSSSHSCFTNCHTRFATTLQSSPGLCIHKHTPPTNHQPCLTILPCSLFSCVVTKSHGPEPLDSIKFSTPLMLHVHMIRYPPTSTASMCKRKIFWELWV